MVASPAQFDKSDLGIKAKRESRFTKMRWWVADFGATQNPRDPLRNRSISEWATSDVPHADSSVSSKPVKSELDSIAFAHH